MAALIILIMLSFSGCALSVDLSPSARHHSWLLSMREEVGRNIFNCEGSGSCRRHRGEKSLFMGDSELKNGNKEAGYSMPARSELRCLYFFEYEVETGLIVGFRYEEKERFACAEIW